MADFSLGDAYLELVDDHIDEECVTYYDEDVAELGPWEPKKEEKPLSRIKQKYFSREDPFQVDDYEFYKMYRFSKKTVKKLAETLFPEKRKTMRGLPFDPEQVCCTALKHMGGVSFKDIYVGGNKATALRHFYIFITEVNKQKNSFIEMPAVETMSHTIKALWERYHLWNIVGTVGTSVISLPKKPRGIPEGDNAKNYKDKNGQYALNIDLTCGADNMIYDSRIYAGAESSVPWERSATKRYLDALNLRVFLLGEPSQVLSDMVITPFARWESSQDKNKALFNLRHSMARSDMTHRTMELMKKRFPRLVNPNHKIKIIKQMLQAAMILHNVSIMWNDPMPQELLAADPLAEPVHNVHEEIGQKYFTESSVQIRNELMTTCLQGPMTHNEKQVLNLTMPVNISLSDPQNQDYSHSVFFTYPHNIS
eukprot:TRINITY_DN10367_c0_g1_i3.p1 TRINITY_DN10367_c0_g1~~TRINITY_DN10367_c0_g1_i3.p1  ORF type:complete len:424 (+),score=90.20 TRINITY_DN10367_c0_g1_i3:67-1338(+)